MLFYFVLHVSGANTADLYLRLQDNFSEIFPDIIFRNNAIFLTLLFYDLILKGPYQSLTSIPPKIILNFMISGGIESNQFA